MAIQSETELYLPVKFFLEGLGYTVKSEVHSCDIVAVRSDGEDPVIVELKRTFNLPLVFQGIKRLKTSKSIYLAVEHTKKKRGAPRWCDFVQLCRMLGLGLITVKYYKTRKPAVEVLCEPCETDSLAPKPAKRRTSRLLYEFHERSGDYNVGGSTKTKLVTAYREQSLHCAYLLKQQGNLSPKELRNMTGNAKVSSILQKNFYGWYKRVERGIYELTPSGEQSLETFSAVIDAKLSETK